MKKEGPGVFLEVGVSVLTYYFPSVFIIVLFFMIITYLIGFHPAA